MTRKLYWEDPHLTRCEARVIERVQDGGRVRIVLDATVFYPESGGQPADRGTINGMPVGTVIMEGGRIVHIVDGDVREDTVVCAVDPRVRRDHMQQHTGQHILSQAILRRLGAGTESLHIGAEVSTIDIPVKVLDEETVQALEDDANEVVFRDVAVETYEVAALDESYRKQTDIQGPIRIVSIAGFDKTPCGGTHCVRTGEVGPIRIINTFKKGSLWRVVFVCGMRALVHARRQGRAMHALSVLLNTPPEEVVSTVEGLARAVRERERELSDTRDELATCILATLAPPGDGTGVRTVAYEAHDADSARRLAQATLVRERLVGIFGAPTDKGATVFVAASPDSGVHAATILQPAMEALGGRGGGNAGMASGSGPDAGALRDALEASVRAVKEEG